VSFRNTQELAVRYGLRVAASASIVVVFLIFLFLLKEAAPFVRTPGLSHLLNARWNPTSLQEVSYGVLPLVTGSVLVTLMATLISIPFGVFGAVYIAELAGPKEQEFLKPIIELVAAIPSVVLGFFGLIVIAPFLRQLFDLQNGLTALTGALVLALMAVPTIITISEDAIRSVPMSYKEASMAMGANRIQTIWRVTVPAAMSGIIASIMLGMGRVIGETMAVIMLTGNAALTTFSPISPVRTMTATIAAEMGEIVFGSEHYQALFWVGILLLCSTFILNVIALRVLKSYQRL
jgi:phosphate transport system permease protein